MYYHILYRLYKLIENLAWFLIQNVEELRWVVLHWIAVLTLSTGGTDGACCHRVSEADNNIVKVLFSEKNTGT
jgi:hypothetical protein